MKLTVDYISELCKLCLTDVKALEIIRRHLKYEFLYTETQKKVFKFIFDSYDVTSKLTTIGVIGQNINSAEALQFLTTVKRIEIDKDQSTELINVFENFIKESKFRVLYDELGDLFNKGEQDKAYKLLIKESEIINNFTLKDKLFTTVFQDFERRQEARVRDKETILLEKLTFGIHELDKWTRGGFNKGTSALFMAISGGGKSTVLRWIGLCNARLGRRVVHFQIEGTEKECLDAYDAGWTAVNLHDIEFGDIPSKKMEAINKARRDIVAGGGEIYVYASETFDAMSINKCREVLLEIESNIGPVDLVIFDYLEILTIKGQYGSSEASERKRREEIANKVTNIAVEFKCGAVAATQSNDIPPDKLENPQFVLTRHHISEFKGCVKPFSYFITLNQTSDEYEAEIMRLWVDKFRKYKKPKKPIVIYQSRSNSRFYNSAKTLKEFGE